MEELLRTCLKRFVVIYNKALKLEERYDSNKSQRKVEHQGRVVNKLNTVDS